MTQETNHAFKNVTQHENYSFLCSLNTAWLRILRWKCVFWVEAQSNVTDVLEYKL